MRATLRRSQFSFGRLRCKLYASQLSRIYFVSRGDMDDVTRITSEPRARGPVSTNWRTPALVIGFGSLIALIAFGPRSTLGFFLTPLSATNHWGRDVFAFALALQNLLWGIGQPLAGIIADRFGGARVFGAGALMYAAGLA